jgi:5-methylcytosine-specific restriction enzyme subunit McrC
VGITVTAHALDLDRPPAELLSAVSELATRITAAQETGRAEADVPPGATGQ